MQEDHQQMSIIIDEYGGVVGIATIEDLIEEIVGEIEDENALIHSPYRKIRNDTYSVEVILNLDDFNDIFDTKLQLDDVDTIAGYLITEQGDIPTDENPVSKELSDGTKIRSDKVIESRIENVIVKIPKDKIKKVHENIERYK